MRLVSSIFVAAAVATLGAGDAFADAEAGQGYFSAMGSYIDDDKDRNVDDGINGFQIGIGKALNEHWNVEAMLAAASPENTNPNLPGPGQEHLSLGVDVQRVFRRLERFSPYLHAGVGYFEMDPLSSASKDGGVMYSVGAGFLLDLFSSNVALRGEFRHRIENSGPSNLSDNLVSLGLQIPFGPATPVSAPEPVDGDADGDGVTDSNDQCPGTPAGVRVDATGCPLDSDGDGVTDDKDKCPGTVAGAAVDADGCELDSDGDGVVDRLDECPGTAEGVQVDIKGCEIKEEITLEGVNFETNSDRLLPGAENILNDAAATLNKNPTIKVEVAGHTDSDGAAEYNEGLSARRAQTVYDYLVNGGVAEDRMTVRGYGESQPIADNSTAVGKAQNRRVVLRIVER